MAEHFERVRALLTAQRFAVLSTRQSSGHPYASLVAFSANPSLTRIVFCTLRTTRKYANLIADGRVSLLVDNRSNRETDIQDAAAVTVLGTCAETFGEERGLLGDQFLLEHPAMADFLSSPACAVMKTDVQSYYLVTHFQHVIELHVEDWGHDGSHSTTG